MQQKLNHWVGLAALLLTMSFFFYKSILSDPPFKEAIASLDRLQSLQILLHRDILRYRNGQVPEYDTLNKAIDRVHTARQDIVNPGTNKKYADISSAIEKLKTTITYQEDLVEDFKTHHSIVQNSLDYYSRLSEKLYTTDTNQNSTGISRQVLGLLSTKILDYARSPRHETALKILPIIDSLDGSSSTETRTLIKHSQMIIDRMPEIDTIINTFNTLDVEQQVANIKNKLQASLVRHEENAKIFNALLFICSLYLIAYGVLLFVSLQRNKNILAAANEKLGKEINERTNTEKTLYSFVEGTSRNSDDSIKTLLNTLCGALDTRYAYLTYFENSENDATIIGLVDSGEYKSNIEADLTNSPCEEVLHNGRLVHNRDLKRYFPDWDSSTMPDVESYIGITMKDNDGNVKGLLAVADDKPIENTNLAESIITLAAARASTELLRQIALRESKRYQDGLELIDHWTARLVATSINADLFYENACYAAQELSNAVLATLPVLDKDNNLYTFSAATGQNSERLKQTTMSIYDSSLCAWSILNKSCLRIDDLEKDTRSQRHLKEISDIKCALATPIIINNESYGAICVFRKHEAFDEVDELLMAQFSQSVQMAVINMQLLSDVASERERAEVTLHSIADAVITTNSQGFVEYMNHVAESLTGWTLGEVKNHPIQTVFRILDRDTREPMHDIVEACLEDGTAINKSMTTLIAKDGSEKEIESSMSTIVRSTGKPDGAVIVFHDETEKRHMEHVILHQATHDSLTGLTNRNEFDRQLTEHIYDARNYGRQHALCYLDLDRFKLVNDTSGHAAGDQLLKQITALLHSCIRGGDILGRLGGDEFGLILENCPHNSAERIAEKIISEISNYQFTWEDRTFDIGVSIGLVPITSDTDNTGQVMKQADLACYTAKDHGRNRLYVYENEDTELIRREDEMHWASRINNALDNDQLRLYAQTIYPIGTNTEDKIHIEILVRLIDDTNSLILPNAFIPAAERFNLMGKIDRRIINDTFEYIAANTHQAGDSICYSINLSGNSLNDKDLASYIKSKIDEYDINPCTICFEITETSAITNLHMTKKLMAELKSNGCCFALDDFGSGLSSFEYLKNLPVDYLKIDGSFVRDMVSNKIDHAMVAAINQIGHVMDIRTIAEFVESDQIIQKLREINIDYVQGYAISRPVPLNEIDIDALSDSKKFSQGYA